MQEWHLQFMPWGIRGFLCVLECSQDCYIFLSCINISHTIFFQDDQLIILIN